MAGVDAGLRGRLVAQLALLYAARGGGGSLEDLVARLAALVLDAGLEEELAEEVAAWACGGTGGGCLERWRDAVGSIVEAVGPVEAEEEFRRAAERLGLALYSARG